MGLALRAHRSAPAATEQRLVAAVRNGDDAAFEELFARYRDRITAYVLSAVRDHGRAEDITQEVFLSALRRLRATERPIAFKPWIYEIAKNASIDEFRRSRRATEVPLVEEGDPTDGEVQLSSPVPPPDVIVEERQKLSNLRGAFGGLSESHHRILVMRELEGRSYGEIGSELGMTRAMVESTLFRARKRLNHEFRELESGQRCEHVRSAIDRSEQSSRMLGIRERRQVARHMAHCHPCRQYAWMSGFDAASLERVGVAEKIAALLPIGWIHKLRHAGRAPGLAAAKVTPRLVRYGEPASQVGLGRALAAATAIAAAAVGGGYAVSTAHSHHTLRPHNAAQVVVSPAVSSVTSPFARPPRAGAVVHAASATGKAGGRASRQPGRASQLPGSVRKPALGGSGGASATLPSGAASGKVSPGSLARSPAGTGSTATGSAPSSSGLGGHHFVGSLLGSRGGSPSSGVRVPKLPSAPSVQTPSVNAPSSGLTAPVSGAVNTGTQAVNSAGQAVNKTTQTATSVVNTASSAVGGLGAGGLPGSGG